jgi:hypothetical protein
LAHRARLSGQLIGDAMVRKWPLLVHRARLSGQLIGEAVVSKWPLLVHRARLSGQLMGEAVVSKWPLLVHRARLSVQPMGEAMVRTRRSLAHRAPLSSALLGEVVLGVLLVCTLALSPRDGVPGDTNDSAVWPQPGVRLQAARVDQPLFGLTLPGLSKLSAVAKASGLAVSSNALIPTSPPVQLLIPALNVHRAVEGVGVNRFGVMDLPVNGWNAGWYKAGPVPGAPCDAVIEGHAGYPDQPMLFGKLATLRLGAQIIVVHSDGTKRLFEVVSMSSVLAGTAPPGLAQPYGEPRLTLVTCTGHFDANNKYYSQRLMVEARYVGLV